MIENDLELEVTCMQLERMTSVFMADIVRMLELKNARWIQIDPLLQDAALMGYLSIMTELIGQIKVYLSERQAKSD